MEIGNHADTTVLGKHVLKEHGFRRSMKVSGCNPSGGQKICGTVTIVVAYDEPQTGQVYLLILTKSSKRRTWIII